MQRYNWYCRILVGQLHDKAYKVIENQLFKNKIVGLISAMANCLLILSFHSYYLSVEKDHS